MGKRVKGQDSTVSLISASGLELAVVNVKSFEMQWDQDILSEGYLGQTTEQKDYIFKGVSGKIEFHHDKVESLDLIQRIVDKARDRLPGEMFQVVTTIAFPNGRRRVVVPDVSFGAIPLNFGSRDDFASSTLEWAASDARTLPA